MGDSSENPWSHNSNAPQIPYSLYFAEKINFAGYLVGAVLYGIVVTLFFQCLNALLNPSDRRRGGVKWPLVVHTVAMFTFVTILTGTNLDIQSTSYIDNRAFPGSGRFPPGPLGYLLLVYAKPKNITPTLMFLLNNLLADGILLYRCYVIYSANYWAIALPCLLFLGSFAMSIVLVYFQISQPNPNIWSSGTINIATSYSISVSLNLLLTLMIVARLIILRKNLKKAMNASVRLGGLYKAVITMLVESCALYAVTSLLYIGTSAAKSPLEYLFFPILSQIQVISPFMIILRVADRSTSTASVVISGIVGSAYGGSQGNITDGDGPLPNGNSTSSIDTSGKALNELGVMVETTVDLHRDEPSGLPGG